MKYLPILALFLLGVSCATFGPHVREGNARPDPADGRPKAHSFYLLGDAGNLTSGGADLNLAYFKEELKGADPNSTLIFLGDNIYPDGMPRAGEPGREEAEIRLNAQIEAARSFPGNTIFIPGNHDWYRGVGGLKRQEEYVRDALGRGSFLPANGCPMETVEISDSVVLIVIDSHWYLTDWDRQPTLNDDCEIRTRARFWEELESEIRKADGKTTVIAIHHPMFTNGPHGGQYSFASSLLPLPGLGFLKNLLRKTSGVSHADLQNPLYRELRKHLVTLARQNEKTVLVSGHEHNLQFLLKDHLPQIVSGAGSKLNPTRLAQGGEFAYGAPGYARLTVYADGSSEVAFRSARDDRTVFRAPVFPADISGPGPALPDSFPDTVQASVYTAAETAKSPWHRILWGERYRRYYSTPVAAPTVRLDTLYGGLRPVQRGGGHQSKSLRLEDPRGTQYVMRALRKEALQYLQTTVFRDRYVEGQFEDTHTENLLLDVFTGAHPYAPFVIADLARAAGVYHTTPRLFYVPRQPTLGAYNGEYGDALYMIEEHASDGHGDKAGFGFSDKAIGTYELLNQLRKDEALGIDKGAYIRARLFDMLIGDWDRHQDQWRWLEFRENGRKVYRPLPRDRDQAFSIMSDGFLLSAATALVPSARLLRRYGPDLRDVAGFNREPYPLDMALLSDATRGQWADEAEAIRAGITAETIERAFARMPVEVQDRTVDQLKAGLLARLENLPRIADRYAGLLSQLGVMTGTDKDDSFVVEAREDGHVAVSVYRIIDGRREGPYRQKTFDPKETRELWLYGLDDDDTFTVTGRSRKIKIRLIGGQNRDTYRVQYPAGVVIYDYKSKKSDLQEAGRTTRKLRDDYESNVYDYRKPKPDSYQVMPSVGSNPDDGFRLGVTGILTSYRFERNPFTSRHQFRAQYFFAPGGLDLGYSGAFANLFPRWNLEVDARMTNDQYTRNFFGFGNTTPNFERDENDGIAADMNYNRVRQQYMHLLPSLTWQGHGGGSLRLGAGVERVETERSSGRFLESLLEAGDPVFSYQNYLAAQASFRYENHDNQAFPTLGMQFGLDLEFRDNLDNGNHFGYLTPQLSIDHKLTASGNLVFATRLKGRITLGDGFEFFQAATLGASDGLRGYRNQRFSGKHSFYQNIDLRYNFNTLKTPVVPVSLGIYAGFDYGRVWVDDTRVLEAGYNRNIWNTSVGGGIWLDTLEMLTARLGVFHANEGMRISFGMGFEF